MLADMSPLSCICRRVRSASLRPTTLAGIRKIGSMTSAARVSCQLSTSIATSTSTRLIRLDSTVDSVEVKACWAPITSELSRETSLPVWVRVKKATGIRDDVVEHLGPQVEDQPFADLGGAPALHQADHRLQHRERGDRDAEHDQQPPVPLEHALVDDLLEQQRRRDRQRRGDHHQHDEDRDQPAVRPGEAEDAAYHALGQLVLRRSLGPATSAASGRSCLRASSTC